MLRTGVRGGGAKNRDDTTSGFVPVNTLPLPPISRGTSNLAASLALIPLLHKNGSVSLRKMNEASGRNDGIPFYSSCHVVLT